MLEGQLIPILREHSKYADLLLLGQDHPEDPDNCSYGLPTLCCSKAPAHAWWYRTVASSQARPNECY